MTQRRGRLVLFLALLAWLGSGLWLGPASAPQARDLPEKISDQNFWQMISDFSEPDGYFRSDNLISNENAFQEVIPQLTARLPRGGVYLGVGPEQNFTYLVALRPKVAFIIDIRRLNTDLHLLYKALIELSSDRADFVSRLFSRKRPAGLGTDSTVETLFESYARVAPSRALYQQNLRAVKDRLTKRHGFALSAEDLRNIDKVYTAFYDGGPDLSYSFAGFGQGYFRQFPTYAGLMTETDAAGEHRSYLASEEYFQILRTLEANNVIIPLVGDFGGSKALRAVGQYLKGHGATVSAFYTSNVEQYLFQQGDAWKRFFTNVAQLPVDDKSTFIRSMNRGWFRYQPGYGRRTLATQISLMADQLQAFKTGKISSYEDLAARAR
jgi:hypothetical protein